MVTQQQQQQIRHRDKSSLTTSRSTIKSRFIHLLLLSGQVELNPGPITPNQSSTISTNYPCGVCQKKVKDSHHALLCDKCELWFHTDCLKFPVSHYSTLLNFTGFILVCTDCATNCSGVKGPSQQAAFLATLDIHKPYIVLGCESKLCSSMCSYEFFTKNYTVFRKDRNVNGGGVFVATSDRIISCEIPDLDTDCEIIWAGLHFSGSSRLYSASFINLIIQHHSHWRPLHLLTIN